MAMPRIGQTVTIEVPSGPFKGEYLSRIEDMDKNWLYLDVPADSETHRTGLLPEGTPIRLKFKDKKNTPCDFDATIGDNLFRKSQLVLVKRPEITAIRRHQRRAYVRVPANLPVELVVMDLQTNQLHRLECLTYNISGGGLSVVLRQDHPLKTGDLIGVNMEIPVDGQFRRVVAKARVVSFMPVSEISSRKTASLQFVELSEDHRQLIIQYVFRREIEMRERGWLKTPR
ncbi:flagellar brake protein [Effusibacillus dendaii]|uniref:Pilus assembly protein PilZ n=1 Tax=Effusibacillus dendaii TaxID=2743772 RepID=A0A7I8DA13_9BACL|nr:PilZ domain-containing protein [Effusibacillus dendaii]BCJ85360.1 hypothetical protein skT53_03450 [Effusibacillus dendaii]